MGRLTKWINYHYIPKKDIKLGAYIECVQKLGRYEDLEEQGRLVEVIRCSECEHYDTVGCADGCGWCDYWDIGRFTNGYCDKAKLKEMEGDKE